MLPEILYEIHGMVSENELAHLSPKYEGFGAQNPPYFGDRCAGSFCMAIHRDPLGNLRERFLGSSWGAAEHLRKHPYFGDRCSSAPQEVLRECSLKFPMRVWDGCLK